MKSKKIIIVIILIIAAAVAGYFIYGYFTGSSNTSDTTSEVTLQSVNSINLADVSAVNRYNGIVQTQKTKDVEFNTSLTLNECYVSVGDAVKEGDALFSYNTQSYELEIQQKQLTIEKQNTTISNDTAQITTLTEKMNKAASSEQVEYSSQILELQSEVAQAQYDIKVAQSEIEKLQSSITNSTVKAEMAGTVTKINDISSLSDSSKVYMTITADGEYRVKGTISEQNISDISEGEAVILRSRVDDTKTWSGTISTIETTPAETDSSTSLYTTGETTSKYTFYVNLDSVDGLMLGQHLTIEKDLGFTPEEGSIWISSGWIVNDDDQPYVLAASSADGTASKRSVTLGEYNESLDLYEITDGLSTSDYLAWPDNENT